MRYCEQCRLKNVWPESIFISRGQCECCDKTTPCYDRPSAELPPVPKRTGYAVQDTGSQAHPESAFSSLSADISDALIATVDSEYPLPDSPHASVIQRALDNRAAMWRGINAARRILVAQPGQAEFGSWRSTVVADVRPAGYRPCTCGGWESAGNAFHELGCNDVTKPQGAA